MARPLWRRLKATSKRDRARRFTTSSHWPYAVLSVRKDVRRAGVLKNRSRTSTVVPRGWGAGDTWVSISRPSATTCQPALSALVLLVRERRATELILASASPRK